MPRAGSFPADADPTSIGEVAAPPYAILPDPGPVFEGRARRFAALAAQGGELSPYLLFLSTLCECQARILAALPEPVLPAEEERKRSSEHGMPQLGRSGIGDDPVAQAIFDALIRALEPAEMPGPTREALDRLAKMDSAQRGELLDQALAEEADVARLAETVLAAAALQVHMTRMAAHLDAAMLARVSDSACPSCGGAPVASVVMGRESMVNTRFCCCSLCATHWHVVRAVCLSCGNERGLVFNSVAGGNENVKAETCPKCKSYTKIVYQNRDMSLDPLADDVGSLALDMLLAGEGKLRRSVNPFLIGY